MIGSPFRGGGRPVGTGLHRPPRAGSEPLPRTDLALVVDFEAPNTPNIIACVASLKEKPGSWKNGPRHVRGRKQSASSGRRLGVAGLVKVALDLANYAVTHVEDGAAGASSLP